jgi:hypothetical protein
VAKIVFRLRNVPDDEADEVRQLLDDNSIPWFETSAGRWGISFPAIWLNDDRDLQRARQLLDAYQSERVQSVRQAQSEVPPVTMLTQFLQRPVRTLLALIFIAVVVYFSITPFLSLHKTL